MARIQSVTGVVSSWIKTFGLAEWIVKPEGGGIKSFMYKNNCPGPVDKSPHRGIIIEYSRI